MPGDNFKDARQLKVQMAINGRMQRFLEKKLPTKKLAKIQINPFGRLLNVWLLGCGQAFKALLLGYRIDAKFSTLLREIRSFSRGEEIKLPL